MEIVGLQISSAYRALAQAQRAFVDDLIAKAESAAVLRKMTVAAVLGELRSDALPQREQDHLTSPLVKAAIYERCRDIDDRNSLTEYKILKVDQIIIEASIDHFMNEDFTAFDFVKSTPDQRLAIESFEMEEKPNGTRKYKLKLYSKHPSQQRLTEISKMRGPDSIFWQTYKRETGNVSEPVAIGDDQAAQAEAWAQTLEELRNG